MNWYLKVLKSYAVFQGRARRKEYWMFFLFNVLISIALTILGAILLGEEAGGVPSMLYSLAVLIPGLAVTVRRLHDTGKSGWWILIGLVPFIGAIVLLIFMVLDGEPGANQFGANPKLEGEDFALGNANATD